RARFRWQDEIIAGQRTLGPARSIAGDGAANETWGAAFEPLVRETPFLQRAQPEIVNEHVGLIDKGCENLLPGRTCHVERDGALVAIHAEEISGLVPGEWGPQLRVSSPLPGGSTLITSAPMSPSIMVESGPARMRVRSMTRIPASGPVAAGAAGASCVISTSCAWRAAR